MAKSAQVNSQVVDSVTQSNLEILGNAPGMALASLYQTIGQAMGVASQNNTTFQQQMGVIGQTATAVGVKSICELMTG